MTGGSERGRKKYKEEYYHLVSRLELIRGGESFFSLLNELIANAKVEIHIQYYILDADSTGNQVISSLKGAASRGVQVYLVLDSYGSSELSSTVIRDLEEAGVNFKWFRPVIRLSNMEFGRRMHHKVVVIDEDMALVTGVNIADRYNDTPDSPAWLDFALLAEGRAAMEIKRRCEQIWEKPSKFLSKNRRFRLPPFPASIHAENSLVKVSINDWLRGKNDIYKGYRNAIAKAEFEIFIVGGYFLPGRNFRKSLAEASSRGVKISVILTGVSDVRFAKPAEEYLYSWMIQNKIHIYEWQPTVMHGKVAVVDRQWSTVGSYNLNYLSTFESIELNLEVIDEDFSSELSTLLHSISEKECRKVVPEEFYRDYSIFKKIKLRFSYWFARTSMRILNAFSNKPKLP